MSPYSSVVAWFGSLPGYAQFAAVSVAVFVVGYLVGRPILDAIQWRRGTSDAVKEAVESSYVALLAVASVLLGFAVSDIGSMPAATGAVLAAATLSAGIGARDILRNAVSGLLIANTRDVSVGSWIQWNGYEGTVKAISLRQTTIKTWDGERVLVPNAELTNQAVVSPQGSGAYRVTYDFGIGYDDDLQRAKQCLLEEVREIPGVADDPSPSVVVTDLDPSVVRVTAKAWVHQPTAGKAARVKSALLERGKERLQAEGISMPAPVRTLDGSVALERPQESEQPGSLHGVQ